METTLLLRTAILTRLSAVLALTSLRGLETTLLLRTAILTRLAAILALTGLGSLETTLPLLVRGCGREGATECTWVVDRRDLSVLEFKEEQDARRAETDREEEEENPTKAKVRDAEHDLQNPNDAQEGRDDAGGAGGNERPLLVGKPVGHTEAGDCQEKHHVEEGVAADIKQRDRVAAVRCERQNHRDEVQHDRREHADQRVGGAHGASAHLAGFCHDGGLELIERGAGGRAELLSGRAELLSRAGPLLATLGAVLALPRLGTGGIAPLATLGAVLSLPRLGSGRIPGLTVLVLSESLLRAPLLRIPVRLGADAVLLGGDLSGRLLARSFDDGPFEVLVRQGCSRRLRCLTRRGVGAGGRLGSPMGGSGLRCGRHGRLFDGGGHLFDGRKRGFLHRGGGFLCRSDGSLVQRMRLLDGG